MDNTLPGALTTAGSIHKVEGGHLGLPGMNAEGCNAFIGDSLANPAGSTRSSGFLVGDRTFTP